jgi:PIN domain nuclease of toxin-antitoxin system
MRLLLDTHIFLWYIAGSSELSRDFRLAIDDPQNDAFLSVVSFWEIIIKNETGKLPLPQSPSVYIPKQRLAHDIACLDLEESSVVYIGGLPGIHRDPFDRMLIAQALAHRLTLVTVDSNIKKYSVPIL